MDERDEQRLDEPRPEGDEGDEQEDLWDRALEGAWSAAESPDEDSEPEADGRIGRYRLIRRIARGGTGIILRGRDEALGREVAIKTLRSRYAEDETMRARFLEEAQIGGQLQHPGIVPVYELGVDAENRPFFSMRLVEGRTLADLLCDRRDPAENRGRLLGIFEQVCQTLAYAHDHATIHRDLKPSNVMIGAFGEVQVVDWGFAKVLTGEPADAAAPAGEGMETPVRRIETVRSGSDSSQSLAGSVVGTPPYMPPEQARGDVEALDERADVFALGAILCEILTLAPPYTAAQGDDLLEQAARGALDEARGRLEACGTDERLVHLSLSCLEPERDRRPRHAGVVARAVADYLAGIEERTQQARVEAAEARVRAEEERKARRLTLALAASVLLLVVAGGAGWWFVEDQRGQEIARSEIAVRAALRQAQDQREKGSWEAAAEALARARQIVSAGKVGERLARDVDARIQANESERRAAAEEEERRQRDEGMLQRLREIRTEPIDDPSSGDDAYAKAFAEYGIDVDGSSPEEAAARIEERGAAIRDELAAALDDWAGRRRMGGAQGGPGPRGGRPPRFLPPDRRPDQASARDWKRLVRIAQALDPHPWRRALRQAALDEDTERLVALANGLDARVRKPRSLVLLGMSLVRAGERETAKAVLEAAFDAHPGDFWINHHLSVLLSGDPGPGLPGAGARRASAEDLTRALRHAWIAVALQPDSVFVRERLARTLLLTGRAKEAVTCLLDGRATAPGRARMALRQLVRRQPLPTRIAMFEAWLEADPEAVFLQLELAGDRLLVGDAATAAREARGVLEREPGNPRAIEVLGDALVASGAWEEALRVLDAARPRPAIMRLREEAELLQRIAPEAARLAAGGGEELSDAQRLAVARVLGLKHETVPAAEVLLDADIDALAREDAGSRRPRRAPGGRPRRQVAMPLRSALRDACALLVAAGRAADGAARDDRRALYRRKALDCLRAALADDDAEGGGPRPPGGLRPPAAALEVWLGDARLAPLRDGEALRGLPPAEREEWLEAWSELRGRMGGR